MRRAPWAGQPTTARVRVEKQGVLRGYRHSLMEVKYDLSHGQVIVGLRFHDERSRHNLLIGNYVSLPIIDAGSSLGFEPAISDVDARQDGQTLRIPTFRRLLWSSSKTTAARPDLLCL